MSSVLTKFHSNLLNRLPPISTGIRFLALHGLVAALLTMIHVETIKLSTKKTTFQLPQNFSNAKLKVSLHADNAAIVYLNGVEIGRQKQGSIIPNFQDAPETFSTNSPFQPGTNVLEFAVIDYGSSSGLNYQAKFNYEHICDVEIDVKPGNPNNLVNLNSNGVIPVAIFGSTSLDVYNIDISSLLLSGAQVKNNKGVYKDINGDGYMDLLVHFYTNQIQIPSSQDYLELTGMTTEDCHLIGSDKIQKVSKNRENHTRDKE